MLLAINAGAYLNTGTYGTPTWTSIAAILNDAMLDISWDEAQIPTRASKVKKGGKTLADVPFTFKLKEDLTDTNFLLFWAALISNTTVVDLLILNAANTVNGARGVRGEFNIMSNSEPQGLADGLVYDLTAKPADTANQFSTAVVASGAPVFTAF